MERESAAARRSAVAVHAASAARAAALGSLSAAFPRMPQTGEVSVWRCRGGLQRASLRCVRAVRRRDTRRSSSLCAIFGRVRRTARRCLRSCLRSLPSIDGRQYCAAGGARSQPRAGSRAHRQGAAVVRRCRRTRTCRGFAPPTYRRRATRLPLPLVRRHARRRPTRSSGACVRRRRLSRSPTKAYRRARRTLRRQTEASTRPGKGSVTFPRPATGSRAVGEEPEPRPPILGSAAPRARTRRSPRARRG